MKFTQKLTKWVKTNNNTEFSNMINTGNTLTEKVKTIITSQTYLLRDTLCTKIIVHTNLVLIKTTLSLK